jgi:hypothetical protein
LVRAGQDRVSGRGWVGERSAPITSVPTRVAAAPMSAIADTSPPTRRGGVAWRAPCWPIAGEARRQGFRAMQFNFVVATNDRAIDTWQRAGFRDVGRLPGAFRHPAHGFVDALVMWRDLPMTRLSLRAGLSCWPRCGAARCSPTRFCRWAAGDRTLDIAPSGIADMDISESGGITDVFLRLMPGPASAFAELHRRRDRQNACPARLRHDPDGGRRPRAGRHGHDLPSRDDDGPGRGDAGALAWAGHM